jgi:hypothetical protein
MRIKNHVYLVLAASFLGAAAGFFGLGFLLLFVFAPDLPNWGQFAVLGSGGTLGYYVPRWIIQRWIPAHCKHCSGPSRPTTSSDGRIRYVCSHCGDSVDTGVTEGRGEAESSD